MKTTHITALTAAVAERRTDTDAQIDACKRQLDDARDTLGRTEDTIRAYERELERLRQFQALGLEHVTHLEFDLSRLLQYREGCDGLLIEADGDAHSGERVVAGRFATGPGNGADKPAA